MNVVVVALDDSPSARGALRWAGDCAASNGAELRVVTAVAMPLAAGAPSVMAMYPVDRESLVETGIARQLAVVDETFPDRALRPTITTTVRLGEAFRVLREESGSADLVVLGAARRARLRSLPRRCQKHLSCPVVVIEDDRPW